jgi:hypothetical protein
MRREQGSWRHQAAQRNRMIFYAIDQFFRNPAGRRSMVTSCRGSNRSYWPQAGAMALFAVAALWNVSFAQDAIDIAADIAAAEPPPFDMSREQWRERVAEAKRRSRQVVIEQRGRAVFLPPTRDEEERQASDRILADDSLQTGDIVSTDKGLFVFRGRPDRERRDGDFVALPPR